MGIFDVFKKKSNAPTASHDVTNVAVPGASSVETNRSSVTLTADTITTNAVKTGTVTNSGINLDKKQAINLRKETVHKICLTKPVLSDLQARVVFAIDYSGSMDSLYRNGTVQETVERILPIALRFDNDGEMGVWMFDSKHRHLKDIDMDNFHGYVEKHIMKYDMGGTRYSGVISDICKKYIDKEPSDIPTYVIFLTDGDCSDRSDAAEAIKEAANHNIFWQFVGLGHASFNFLESLDNMPGRKLDNADFFAIGDITKVSDEALYNELLNEFPGWVTQARQIGMIK